MVLNAYGSAVVGSDIHFAEWAHEHNLHNPIQRGSAIEKTNETKVYDKLIKQGYKVEKSPFTMKFGNDTEASYIYHYKKDYPPEVIENYKVEKFLFQYVYIATLYGLSYAQRWLEDYKNDEYNVDQKERAIKHTPKLAYCHLVSEGGQCNMFCPFWNGSCHMSQEDKVKSLDLLNKYKIKKRIKY